MKILFVRHAQCYGNVDGKYDTGYKTRLTPLGYKQADALAEQLMKFNFDVILTSPAERAMHTVLPYLKLTSRKAEVWPEFVEMRGRKDIDTPLPPEIRYNGPVEIPADLREFFTLRADREGMLMPPLDESYEEGQRRATLAAQRLLQLYGNTETSVLLVAHACNGARVIEALMRIPLDGRFQHVNTGATLLQQKANGDFITLFVNRILIDPALLES
jgi:broad specificity phosphatase PhoE